MISSSDFDPDHARATRMKRLCLRGWQDSASCRVTLEIGFTAYGGSRQRHEPSSAEGTLALEVSKSGGSSSSKGDIVLRA